MTHDKPEFQNTIWAVNPERLRQARRYLPNVTQLSNKSIGYWWWELDRLPRVFHEAGQLVDEIWAPSNFIAENLAKELAIPVIKAPLVMPSIPMPEESAIKNIRHRYGLKSDDFVVLTTLDVLSSIDRKNLRGAIAAFERAFAQPSEARLLIKLLNTSARPKILERINAWAAENPAIQVIDETLTRNDMLALIASCDAMLGLHRSEGLGLHLVEAMAVGTLVITSRYSGNLDFCTEDNCILIGGQLVPAHDTTGQYLNLPGASWFEPDIAESAEALIRLYKDPELRKKIAGKGRETYMRFRDSHEMRSFVTDRLAEWARPEPAAALKLNESPPWVEQSPLKKPEVGVNLIGYLESEFGMGEYARRLLATLQSAKVPTRCEVLQSRAIRSTEVLPPEQARAHGDSLPFPINLVIINADDMRGWADTEGKALIRDRYTIGVWAWELETFPLDLHKAFDYVDEIWAISKFSANSIAEFSPVPVFALPPLMGDENPITEEQKNQIRKNLRLEPDDFLVTFTFDYYGTLERKNPAGVIRAFMSAFKPDDGATLILKSTNESTDLPGRAALHELAAQRPDIRFVEEYWAKAQMRALVAASDVYISLHRSEGLGLGLAEALSSGVRVVTTAYGGHLDLANDSNATLVDYQLQPVGDKAQPYPADAWWAEPNTDNAARHLRRIFNEARAKPRQMHKPSKLRASLKAKAKDFIKERLQTIASELAEYSPQPLILSPIEGTTEPEGDQKNPVWWQVQPSAWYEFRTLSPSLDMSRLSVSIFITNVSCKRLATITITLGQSKVKLRMKSANERFMVSLPLKSAKPTDEIRIDVESAPMRLDGDNRDLYLLVGPTYVSENTSQSSEATYRRINAPSSSTDRIRQSILRLFSG